MRELYLVLVFACACNPSDDMKTHSGTGTSNGTSMTDGTATTATTSGMSGTDGTGDGSGSESAGTTSPTTGGDPACGGDHLCSGVDVADCIDDPCCVAAFGRRYAQDGDAWCLGADEEYVGCAHEYNSLPCDYVGTIQCLDENNEEYFAELASECFPHWCSVGTTPVTGGAVCGA